MDSLKWIENLLKLRLRVLFCSLEQLKVLHWNLTRKISPKTQNACKSLLAPNMKQCVGGQTLLTKQ
jgi:hypothetical protein